MVKIVHVNTLTPRTAPTFLRGVPTIYFHKLKKSEQLFEGDGVLSLLRDLPVLEEVKEKFRGVSLQSFGIGTRGRRTNTCSTIQIRDLQSSKPIDNRVRQMRSTASQITQAKLKGAYARDGKALHNGMSMKERIDLLNTKRQQSEARMAKLQTDLRVANPSRNFLDARDHGKDQTDV